MKARPIIFSAPMIRSLLAGTKTQTRRAIKHMPEAPAPASLPACVPKHPAPYFDAYCGDRKTPENPRGQGGWWCWWQVDDRVCLPMIRCPYGRPGDLLWVRETWADLTAMHSPRRERYNARTGLYEHWRDPFVWYQADGDQPDSGSGAVTPERWRSPIHMPRWASRLTLRLTDVRAQRVQEIGEEDARAEGITDGGCLSCGESEPCGCANPQPDARDAFAWLWNSINEQRGYPWVIDPWVWALTFDVLPGNVDQYLEAA